MYIKKRGKAKAKAAEGAAGKDEGAAAAQAGDKQSIMTHEDDFDHRLGQYQLMEAIGKGGYGTVYRGLNIERGMTVAVKRVGLQGIPHEELEGIEVRSTCNSTRAPLPELHSLQWPRPQSQLHWRLRSRGRMNLLAAH